MPIESGHGALKVVDYGFFLRHCLNKPGKDERCKWLDISVWALPVEGSRLTVLCKSDGCPFEDRRHKPCQRKEFITKKFYGSSKMSEGEGPRSICVELNEDDVRLLDEIKKEIGIRSDAEVINFIIKRCYDEVFKVEKGKP